MLCSVEYDNSTILPNNNNNLEGIRTDTIAILPKQLTDNSNSNSNHSNSNRTFINEKDFQSLLPDIAYLDPNDPKNDKLLYLKLKSNNNNSNNKLNEIFQLYNSSNNMMLVNANANGNGQNNYYYDNYMKLKSSLRLQLLLMRNNRPFLFTGNLQTHLMIDLLNDLDSLSLTHSLIYALT